MLTIFSRPHSVNVNMSGKTKLPPIIFINAYSADKDVECQQSVVVNVMIFVSRFHTQIYGIYQNIVYFQISFFSKYYLNDVPSRPP